MKSLKKLNHFEKLAKRLVEGSLGKILDDRPITHDVLSAIVSAVEDTRNGTLAADRVIVKMHPLTLEALEQELPEPAGGDSFDFSPVLLGKSVDGPIRRTTILQTGRGLLAFRHDHWKLRLTENPVWQGEEVELPRTSYELYNLEDDPGEMHDLSETYPERAMEMRKLLLDLLKKGRSR